MRRGRHRLLTFAYTWRGLLVAPPVVLAVVCFWQEYENEVVVWPLGLLLFLGGWGIPFAWFGWDSLADVPNWMNVAGPLILFTKMILLTFLIMWVRFSYPRFREDQLQTFAWKVLIPLSLANIAVTAILKVAI
jgi:NADH-quinone oxidoreductase subunit H